MASREEASEIKRKHAPRLLQQAGVSGVGVEKDASGDYVLAVHVAADAPDVVTKIPDRLEGIPVKIIRSGPFRSLGDEAPS
jgi:hypothetical protein